jgi:hypothetical protein
MLLNCSTMASPVPPEKGACQDTLRLLHVGMIPVVVCVRVVNAAAERAGSMADGLRRKRRQVQAALLPD